MKKKSPRNHSEEETELSGLCSDDMQVCASFLIQFGRGEMHMERNRREKEGGVLSTVAELFDLPADVVAGLPRLEMVGSRQLYLEHHSGILAYSQEQIDANTSAGVLRVKGERLTLLAMTGEELRIGGRIDAVEWVR